MWATVWDSDRDALEFDTAVRKALDARYVSGPERVGRDVQVLRGAEGRRPTVVVWDTPAGFVVTDGIRSVADFELREQVDPRGLE